MRPALILFSTALLAVLSAPSHAYADPQQQLRAAAIIPLTGSNAVHGEYARRGIELALRAPEARDVLQIDFQDNQSVPAATVSAYSQARAGKDARAVLTLGSPMGMVLAPLANRDRVLLFAMALGQGYSSPNDYTYRIISSAAQDTAFLVAALARLGKHKVAILFVNHDYGESSRRELEQALAGREQVIAAESFNPDPADLRPQLLRLKQARPDIIYAAAWGRDVGLALKQAAEIGLDISFICTQACQTPEVIQLAGAAAEGLLVVAPTDAADERMREDYRAAYHEDPIFVSLRFYDATRILSRLGRQCQPEGQSADCLLAALRSLKNFPGCSYKINFDNNGDLNEQVVLKVVRNGRFVLYQ